VDELREILRTWFGEAAGISVAEIRDYPLYPEEEALMARAIAKRRAEFSTGRWCAREALREIGVEACAILTGALREPLWPPGITGSITHAGGIGAAIALPASLCRGVGIDILNEQEAKALLPPPESPLTFSAKESAIKALSSTAGRFIDLAEIRLTFGEPGRFVAAFGASVVQGWWQRAGEFLVTAAVAG
jgi:4'-phosphopantetheinyl transferase EntD